MGAYLRANLGWSFWLFCAGQGCMVGTGGVLQLATPWPPLPKPSWLPVRPGNRPSFKQENSLPWSRPNWKKDYYRNGPIMPVTPKPMKIQCALLALCCLMRLSGLSQIITADSVRKSKPGVYAVGNDTGFEPWMWVNVLADLEKGDFDHKSL